MALGWTQIKRVLERVATKEEEDAFNVWLNESIAHREYFKKIERYYYNTSKEEIRNLKVAVRFNAKQITNNGRNINKVRAFSMVAVSVAAALALISFLVYSNSDGTNNIYLDNTVTKVVEFSKKIEATDIELITGSGAKITIDNDKERRVIGNANIKGDTLNYTKAIAVIELHTLVVPRGKTAVITLEDGTLVHLNSQSQLKFPNKFVGGERRVYLTGEAYFIVKEDKNQKFIVSSNGSDVKVYGTEFNVKSYEDELYTNVILVKGSVSVSNKKDSALLKPGEKAVLERKVGSIAKSVADSQKELAWMRNEFYYENVSLETIIDDLRRNYNEDIIIQNIELRECKVTFCISKDRSIDDIMSIINKNNSIEVVKKEKSYIIK